MKKLSFLFILLSLACLTFAGGGHKKNHGHKSHGKSHKHGEKHKGKYDKKNKDKKNGNNKGKNKGGSCDKDQPENSSNCDLRTQTMGGWGAKPSGKTQVNISI